MYHITMCITYYRKTQVGDFELAQLRTPRFIGQDKVLTFIPTILMILRISEPLV